MALRQYTNTAIFPWPNYVSARYYNAIGQTSPLAYGTNILRAASVMFHQPLKIDRIGTECVTVSDTNALCRLGIYSDSSGLPNTLLLDAGTTAAMSTVGWFEVTTSFVFNSFTVYWLATCTQNVAQDATAYTGNPTWRTLSGFSPLQSVTALTANEVNAGCGALHSSAVTGALPGTFTNSAGTANNVQAMKVGYRAV